MSRIVLRTVQFIVLGVLIGRVLGYSAASFEADPGTSDYMDEAVHLSLLLDKAETIQALSVGSSHSGAINFEVIGEEGFHYWKGGGDILEIQYRLKTLLPRLPTLQRVYISVPYSYFTSDNSRSRPKFADLRRRQMYATLPSWTYIGGDTENFIRGKFHHIMPLDYIMRGEHWARVLARLYGDVVSENFVIHRMSDGYLANAYNCDHMNQYNALYDATTVREMKKTMAELSRPTILPTRLFYRSDNQ